MDGLKNTWAFSFSNKTTLSGSQAWPSYLLDLASKEVWWALETTCLGNSDQPALIHSGPYYAQYDLFVWLKKKKKSIFTTLSQQTLSKKLLLVGKKKFNVVFKLESIITHFQWFVMDVVFLKNKTKENLSLGLKVWSNFHFGLFTYQNFHSNLSCSLYLYINFTVQFC